MATIANPKNYSFPDDFQDLILSSFLRHPADLAVVRQLVKPTYFRSVIATVTATCIFKYDQKYGAPPSFEALTDIVCQEQARLSGSRDEALSYVAKLREIETSDVAYVKERIIDFAKERATLLAVLKAIDKVKAGDTDGLSPLFEEAEKIGGLDDYGLVLHDAVDEVVDKVTAVDYGVMTGYPAFDRIWRRGWQPGWLVVLLAPPKRYKSAMCANLALGMVGPSIDAPVFYYPCEISQELTLARMYSNISGLSMEKMYENPQQFKQSVHASMESRVNNYLVVKGFPSGAATMADIDRHASATEKELGVMPKAIFIDYAETIAYSPDTKGQPEHQQQASIYLQARALAAKHHCAVIMPDRINRETVEKRVPSMTSFQGAYKKAGIVDVAIGICATDEEYANNILRFFVFINRHGAAFGHFRGKVDPETMDIDVGEEIGYTPEDNSNSESTSRRRRRNAESDEISRVLDED